MVCIEKTASLKAFEHGKERERSLCLTDDDDDGTGILFEEPNPTGSRPSDLIGLYTKWQRAKRPQPAKRSSREEGGATGDLFERETEHLY